MIGGTGNTSDGEKPGAGVRAQARRTRRKALGSVYPGSIRQFGIAPDLQRRNWRDRYGAQPANCLIHRGISIGRTRAVRNS